MNDDFKLDDNELDEVAGGILDRDILKRLEIERTLVKYGGPNPGWEEIKEIIKVKTKPKVETDIENNENTQK